MNVATGTNARLEKRQQRPEASCGFQAKLRTATFETVPPCVALVSRRHASSQGVVTRETRGGTGKRGAEGESRAGSVLKMPPQGPVRGEARKGQRAKILWIWCRILAFPAARSHRFFAARREAVEAKTSGRGAPV